jgi:hypothetical protein
MVVTLVPLTVTTIFAHRILRLNPVIICGALAGAMTVDAAVTGCCERADSQTPVLGVAVPYAVGNVLLTIDRHAPLIQIKRSGLPSGKPFAYRPSQRLRQHTGRKPCFVISYVFS